MVLQVCARSLWPTLASAVSTLTLFGATHWGVPDFLDEGSFIRRLLLHTIFAFAMPLFPLQVSLRDALSVWSMKQSIHKRKISGRVPDVGRASISIFSICPLYIEVPLSASKDFNITVGRTRGYTNVEFVCLKALRPLELSPREAIGDPHATATNTDLQQQHLVPHDNQKKYLQLISVSFMDLKPFQEKEVLLTLGLVPDYSQLRYLRSRSRFQAVVTALQAGGYVLSVVQRLAQHPTVCPLEALLCFLSVIIMLQLLLELYACSHYQRPLLLRLNHHQFSQFWHAPRDGSQSSLSRSLERFGIIPYVTDSVLLVMLFSALSIYYSVHYMHSCPVCSVAALLFLFALLSWVISLIFFMKRYETRLVLLPGLSGLVFFPGLLSALLLSVVLFISSMVLAVVSTASNWDLFHSPTDNSFSWILPHVSS